MRRLVLLTFLAATLSGSFARAAESTVRAVEIRKLGKAPLDESLVRSYLTVEVGTDLDPRQVTRDIKALLGTDVFSHASASAETGPDGLTVVFSVQPRPRLASPILLVGVTHFRESKVLDWLNLRPGDVVDDSLLGARAQAVLEEYHKDKYVDVRIDWDIEVVDEDEGRVDVTFTVEEGGRSRVGSVTFVGNDSIESSDLRKAMRQSSPYNPFRWIWKRRYDEDEIRAGGFEVRNLYLDRGYQNVRVEPIQTSFDEDGLARLTVTVDEGQLFRVGGSSVTGVTLFPQEEIERLVAIPGGAPAGERMIMTAANRIRDFYGSRGYIRTRVNTVKVPRPDDVMDLRFNVTEGALVKIGNIRIRGNSRTRDKVIRRELLVYPGDAYNSVRARTSERRLNNLGFFSTVRRYPMQTSSPDVEDLIFDVEEKPTGQFMIGAGFSSVENLIGFIELSQGNFDIKGWPSMTGGGQKLKLRGQFGSVRKDYDISFVEPWFLNRKLALGLNLFRTEIDYTDYDVDRTGGAVSLRKALPGPNSISFRYSLERVEISDQSDTNRYLFVEQYADFPGEDYSFTNEENRVKSTFRVALTHDTRNSPFIPTRGTKATAFGAISGGLFGFDTDIMHVGVGASHYIPLWFGHVLSARLRYEVVSEYGDTDEIPISDRLFIGGGRTLRGFDYRDVGPKVQSESAIAAESERYRPVGGRSFAQATVEYTIPLVDGIRFAGFYDTGNVWRGEYDLHFDDLAAGAGVGFRLDMPGFPIRIDYAWVVEREDELTDSDRWVIWIGYDY